MNLRSYPAFWLIAAAAICLLAVLPPTGLLSAEEDGLQIEPPVMDLELAPEEVAERTVTLHNNSDRRRILFVFPQDISGADREAEVLKEQKERESLSDWLVLPPERVEVEPGASKDISVGVQVDSRAEPGLYHAYLSFAPGTRRSEAADRITRDQAIFLSVEVADQAEDLIHISGFGTEGSIVSGSPIAWQVELENRGDTELTPQGELIVYDSQGKELGALPFNRDEHTMEPGAEKVFTLNWQEDLGWGRHRARLALSYGSRGEIHRVDDTAFFRVLPWMELTAVFLVLLAVLLYLINIVHQRAEQKHRERLPQVYQGGGPVEYYDEPDPHTIDLRGRDS